MLCLITRPLAEANLLKNLLEPLKIQCLIDPLLTIKPIIYNDSNLEQIFANNYQFIIITSSNAIKSLANYPALVNTTLFTVGKKTANYASQIGFKNVICAGSTVNELINYIIKNCSATNGELLYLRGTHINCDLSSQLSKYNYAVKELITYQAVPAKKFKPSTILAFKSHKINIILFFSQRSAKNFLLLIEQYNLTNELANMIAIAFSENIARILYDTNWKEVKITSQPTIEAMIELLAGYQL